MSAALELLGEIRQSSERRPFEVLKLAEPLLNKGTIRQAGDDLWLVYEQVFLAALDEGQFALAKSILDQLYKQFPGSQRVKRLYGLINEGLGHPEEAQQLYKEMLAADETNVLAAKRQIAMLKASGDHAMAIGELNTYLDTHSNDFEAWLELAHLYLGQHMYAQAAFCLEEVILQQPANHYFHLKYAELLYSMGSLGKALKEFLRVTELSTDNVRGFYGVKLCADRIMAVNAASKGKKPANVKVEGAPQGPMLERLAQLATERLAAIYSKAPGACKKTNEEWLKA